jgi:hypothetical protein
VTTRIPTSQISKMGSGRIPQMKGRGPLLLRLEDCTLRQPLPHPLRSAEPPEKRGSSPGLAWSTRRRAGEEREWEGEMRAVWSSLAPVLEVKQRRGQ